jgi:translation elongation factor EF-1alpha
MDLGVTIDHRTCADVQFLPISGLFGHNMKERMPKTMCDWWDGPCLFEALDSVELPERDPKGPFRYLYFLFYGRSCCLIQQRWILLL